ncbi:MAG: nucleotidyl transferase AbiEii/AbiGii toxin family protein [Treponema sp.]|jgi:hypothetical protein|nr:nucleotidyl transferase AbiEii/AbiGii toxin family protein [Treponema sp.]
MFKKEAVPEKMLNLIKDLQGMESLKDYMLAGGTALAIHLNHRTSTDVDLFSYKEHNVDKILGDIELKFGKYEKTIINEKFMRLYLNNIKVEFVFDNEGKRIKEDFNKI